MAEQQADILAPGHGGGGGKQATHRGEGNHRLAIRELLERDPCRLRQPLRRHAELRKQRMQAGEQPDALLTEPGEGRPTVWPVHGRTAPRARRSVTVRPRSSPGQG